MLQEYIPIIFKKVTLQLCDGKKNAISAIIELMTKIWSSINAKPHFKLLFEQNITELLSKFVSTKYE